MSGVLAVFALCGTVTLLSSAFPLKPAMGDSLVSIEALPRDAAGFAAMRDGLGATPEGAAALFVAAMNVYVDDEALGRACLTAILVNDPELVSPASPGDWKGYEPSALVQRRMGYVKAQAGIARSLVQGTDPAASYALPPFPWTVRARRNAYSVQDNGDVKVFVFSTGADSPRPVTLRRNAAGVWKVAEFSSLVSGVRKAPAAPGPDGL